MLSLINQRHSLKEVQEPPLHIWRFAAATSEQRLGLCFLIDRDCLTSVTFGTVVFLLRNSVLHNQQGEARFKEINWENFMEASSFKKGRAVESFEQKREVSNTRQEG